MNTSARQEKTPPIEVRLKVLSAIDYAPGNSIIERIKNISKRSFNDDFDQAKYQFTWRTISTWFYRYKSKGITSMETKTRSDKNIYRKVKVNELAEAIKEVMPSIKKNKVGKSLKMAVYRTLIKKGLISRSQLAPNTFYRMVRENDLFNKDTCNKLRLSFSMKYVNEMWQADTMYGPSIKQANGKWKKTFLIAFIDDASRVITHGEFFYNDNTENMIDSFRTALYKRGKPERLYFDNGSNYSSKEILQACLRMNILLSHAPIRDGAAKGKIERFFRGFRDRFLTTEGEFSSLDELNEKTQNWLENEYNSKYHSGIQMIPIDRFNLDISRVNFITEDQYSEEVFFFEEKRKVGKTNNIRINNEHYECPVDLRDKWVDVRFDRKSMDRFVIYFNNKRMGKANLVDLNFNAKGVRENMNKKRYNGEQS